MTEVSKAEFDAFIADHVGLSQRSEPRIEVDGEYKYECFDNDDGDEVAFITWRKGEATYHIAK